MGGLGDVDVQDCVAALRLVARTYSADTARVAAIGTNYGGYLALKASLALCCQYCTPKESCSIGFPNEAFNVWPRCLVTRGTRWRAGLGWAAWWRGAP